MGKVIINKTLILSFAAVVVLSACQSSDVDEQKAESKLPKVVDCSSQLASSPPIQDIWQLEPMLVKDGLITESMSKEQKEQVIREYISKKNSQFEECKPSKKPGVK